MQNRFNLFTFLAFISAAILIAAVATQYGWLEFVGIKKAAPCPLCIWARIPYVIAIIISAFAMIIGFFTKKWGNFALNIMLFVLFINFATGVGISGYHVGVEHAVFPPPELCSAGMDPSGLTIEQIREQLTNKVDLAACHIPAKIYGLSMALLNVIASLLMAIICLVTLVKRLKRC